MNLVIHPSTQAQSYVFGANLHVKPLQAVSLSEFALRLFSLVWGIWLRSPARSGIYSKSFLNWLFRSSRWLVMAVLARKITQYENSADWVSVNLTHSCPFWTPTPTPSTPPSMICAWGPVTHASFKSSEGKYLDDPDGGVKTWWGLCKSRAKRCKARQMWRVTAATMTAWLDSYPLCRHPPQVSIRRQILCI